MKKKILSSLLVGTIVVTALYFSFDKKLQASSTLPLLTNQEIQEVIEEGVKWFKNKQEKNGHFRYEYMPFLNRYIDDDNMVRQAGALYVLGEIFIRDTNNKHGLQKYIEKAISYFEENSAKGQLNGISFRCILKTESKCSIGAVGLAFVGILDLVEKKPALKSTYQQLIDDYLNYMIAMKKPGEGFRNAYYINGGQSEEESPYGNGEAFLALVRYYKYNPTEEVKEIIDDSFEYFEGEYRDAWDSSFYLWGMAAVKDLYELDPREEYLNFVKGYTDWRIAPYKNRRNTSRNRCAYIEGVASAYSVLEPNVSAEERAYYLEEINYWLTDSKDLQVKSGDILIIRFNREVIERLNIEKANRADGGFLTGFREPVQRIDFTQHCLSSYLQKLVDIDGDEL